LAPVVCIHCGTPLPPGPQSLHVLELDPATHAAAAKLFPSFRYRLCNSCRTGLSPDSRAQLEENIRASLDITGRLSEFAEHHEQELFRSDPSLQAGVKAALGIHQRFQSEIQGDIRRFQAYAQALQGVPPGTAGLLGTAWIESVTSVLQACEAAYQGSQGTTSTLQRRLGIDPRA
jgi:hypothetical protein